MYYIQDQEGNFSKPFTSFYEATKEKNEKMKKGEKGLKVIEFKTIKEEKAIRTIERWAKIHEAMKKLDKNK